MHVTIGRPQPLQHMALRCRRGRRRSSSSCLLKSPSSLLQGSKVSSPSSDENDDGSGRAASPSIFHSLNTFHHSLLLSPMSERRAGFGFHAVRPPKPDPELIKQPNSHEHSANFCGGRRFGFPSSMFQRGDGNNAWPDPTLITDGGWVRPSPTGWSLPPDEPLEPAAKSSNTSAANIRRSPAAIAAVGNKLGWGSGQAFPAMKKATGLETIGSSEAAKKYGGRFVF